MMLNKTRPFFSVIIPARNEEKHLPLCLRSIHEAAGQGNFAIEIIVVLNRCHDRTAEIALAHDCRLVRNDSKNLSQIRNAGVARAAGEYIITIDADSRMSVNLLSEVSRQLADPGVIGGGVLVLPDRISLGILLTGLCIFPLLVRSRFSAGLFYCRKNDFYAIGGFDETLPSVEDIDFAARLRLRGKATGRRFKTIWGAHIETSCRKFDKFGDWYFLRHPRFFKALLSGSNQEAANKYWYDCER